VKAIEQYFHVVLFIMLCKVVLTFKSVDETLVGDHSIESYCVVLSCGTVWYAVGGSMSVQLNETLVCGHSNESYRVVHSFGTVVVVPCKLPRTFLGNVYFSIQCSGKFVDESQT